MKKITYQGEDGVFYSQEEFQSLQSKILEQNQLIQDLLKKVVE
jgi:hypothetical protein